MYTVPTELGSESERWVGFFDGADLNQVEKFKYLESKVNIEGTVESEIANHVNSGCYNWNTISEKWETRPDTWAVGKERSGKEKESDRDENVEMDMWCDKVRHDKTRPQEK